MDAYRSYSYTYLREDEKKKKKKKKMMMLNNSELYIERVLSNKFYRVAK